MALIGVTAQNYSQMPYYQDLNILFVHIPKTGGSSVEGFLKEKNSGKQTLYSGAENKLIPNKYYQKYSLQHQFYSTLYQYRKELEINFNHKLSVISIVRNPYHRLISGLFWEKLISRDSTKEAVYKAAKAYVAHDNLDNHNTPQYKYLIDEHGMLYKHIRIFRTETLTQDVKRYGFQDYNGRKTPNTYWQFYNQDLLDLVNDFYKKDFEYLGYTQIMFLSKSNEFHENSVNENLQLLQPIKSPSSIFIAIPSYVDLELKTTILDCINKATHSSRLHFGVCLQWDKKEGLEKDCIDDLTNDCNIVIDKYFYKASDGVGWARNKAQQLYNKETYFLQIDAHTRFIDNWDELLIADFENLKQRVEKPIISYFPPAYRENNGKYIFNYANELDKINIPAIAKVTEEYCFEYTPHNEVNTGFKNINTPVLDGSFIFTDGAWAKEIMQDPEHYYFGEEVALSLRSFTKGYDFYTPKQILAWHGSHRSPRRKHYEEHLAEIVKIKHQMSMLRLKALMEEKDLGGYGLNKQRSLKDFRTTTGVDVVNRQIDSLKIKHYTIFGERNSGTNYLATVLNAHITLQFTKKFGFKHWFIKNHFPRGRANKTTDNECLSSLKNSEDTLFIFIVRNPYDWCGAMKVKPYHMKEIAHSSIYDFISNKYISYEDNLPPDHGPASVSPWYLDEVTNKYFIDEATNLIELRNSKNNHFYTLKNEVKNFHIIRQENLAEDIQEMIEKFNLATKSDELLVEYEKPTKYDLDEKSRQFIAENLNNKIDNIFYSNNSRRTNSTDLVKFYLFEDNLHGEKKYVLYEGVINNPKTLIVNTIEECDYIFVDFRDIPHNKKTIEKYHYKTIVVDYSDGPNTTYNVPCWKYFKRSVINKKDSTFHTYNREVFPITYCIKTECLEFKDVIDYKRNIDIAVFFNPEGNSRNLYRLRMAAFIKENFADYNIHVGICGINGEIGRSSIQKEYYEKMFQSKIVINCNPDRWEGDYRTFEALSTGALVMVDYMKMPIVNPLVDGKHIVFYDKENMEELKKKVDFLLQNDEIRTKIAQEGYTYALQYHKASNRIDEILSVINADAQIKSLGIES